MSGGGEARDPEIARLFLEEIRRHEPRLASGVDVGEQRRSIHALKGSAALAGERLLADALGRLERRFGAGETEALEAARALLRTAAQALEEGRSVPTPAWPEPPSDLRGSSPPPAGNYVAEMRDRIERFDAALSSSGRDVDAVAAAYREVHAMKGAALAAADEAMAWFCHGLEERLRPRDRSEAEAARAMSELSTWRPILLELLVAPDRALESLSQHAKPRGSTTHPPSHAPLPLPPRRPTVEPSSEGEPRSTGSDDTLRVPTATLDRVLERVRQIGQARAHVTVGAALVEKMAERARGLRLGLMEALRLIGPPRPWGAPAAAIGRIEAASREIDTFASELDRESAALKETADRVRSESAAAQGDLAQIRMTRAAWVFERVAAAVGAESRRGGREVRFYFSGEETPMDRRAAEGLFDPLLQLARNAIAHGAETASERASRGKPRALGIRLSAEPRSGGLRIVVHDDGAGVNVSDVRARAVASGTIPMDMARVADDPTLLALLFVPGFTTRDSADLLSGRGVGLDLALEAVHRLGGTIRLASEAGVGVTATVDIPFEPGLMKVLWIESLGMTFALPIQHVARILRARDPEAEHAVALAELLRGGQDPDEAADFAIEIAAGSGKGRVLVAVDKVGLVEEVTVRRVAPVVATAGPFAGAIVRGDALRLCLDGHALAERAAAS